MSGASTITRFTLEQAGALLTAEPADSCIVTCAIMNGSSYEDRAYGFNRCPDGWIIDTDPGILRRASWADCVRWLLSLRPVNVEVTR